jgi:hypothetical protein
MAAICWLRISIVALARPVACFSASRAVPSSFACARAAPPDSRRPCRRARSDSAPRRVVCSEPRLSSVVRRPERSSASRSVSSAICRLSRSSTVSRPEISRARKNWPTMKMEIRNTIARRRVDRASTKPGQ